MSDFKVILNCLMSKYRPINFVLFEVNLLREIKYKKHHTVIQFNKGQRTKSRLHEN